LRNHHIGGVLRKFSFIEPTLPTLAKTPPIGPEWLHEAKLDGWRAQVHVHEGTAAIYSRNGSDITQRFAGLLETIRTIPSPSAILDCELVACDAEGLPSFKTLMELGGRAPALCL
jgi:bifunctional non-homologous end joining protein LigD